MMETKNEGEVTLPYNGRGHIDINSSHDVNSVLGVMSLQKKFQGFYKCEHNQSGYQFHWPFPPSLQIISRGRFFPIRDRFFVYITLTPSE